MNISKIIKQRSSEPPPFPQEFKYEKGTCALEYWEPLRLLKEGSISDIHLVRRRPKRINVRYKKKRDIMKFAKEQQGSSPLEEHENDDLYVLKSIMKDHVDNDLVLEEMRSELQTMSQLKHPNIAKLYEAYERRRHIYLVMELCPNGDLSDRTFSEKEAAVLVRQILEAVAYMHSKGVVHRDLKLENIMLDEKGNVKIIDLGLATKYLSDEHKVMTDRVGTLYAMAPQVLQGRYTSKCDMWSIGVIAYMLLSGINPFWGPPRPMPWSKRRKVMIDRIMRGQYTRMTGPKWDGISPQAKDFCACLLQMDPDDRPTAKEALQSEWIQQEGYSLPDEQIVVTTEQEQQSRRMMEQFQHDAIHILAQNLSEEKVLHLQRELEKYDSNGDGRIALADFHNVLESTTCIPKEKVEPLFEKMTEANSSLDYNDFIIRVLGDRGRTMLEETAEALDELDVEGTRRVNKGQLESVLEKILPKDELSKVCDEVGMDDDGNVSTVEVLTMVDKLLVKSSRDSLRSIGDKDEAGDDLIDEKNVAIPGGSPIQKPKYVYKNKSMHKVEHEA